MTLLKKLRDASVALFEFGYCPLTDVSEGWQACFMVWEDWNVAPSADTTLSLIVGDSSSVGYFPKLLIASLKDASDSVSISDLRVFRIFVHNVA